MVNTVCSWLEKERKERFCTVPQFLQSQPMIAVSRRGKSKYK